MKPHGPWKIINSKEVYRDPWIDVQRDEVIRPDGEEGTHCVVRMKPGVCVVALDDDGFVHLTEEFHYGIGRHSVEGVSGGIDPGETALETAQRELEEELGLKAERWTDLGCVDPFTTIVVSPTQLYLAEGLSEGVCRPEGTELIRLVKLSLGEAVSQVLDSRITHGPTATLLLKIQLLHGNQASGRAK
ncbi:MAG: NUDIX hydrolase [Planctomycetaceae bacterium]|nr:NUDIX hydrolase [Planctomycetaceae bacterium]